MNESGVAVLWRGRGMKQRTTYLLRASFSCDQGGCCRRTGFGSIHSQLILETRTNRASVGIDFARVSRSHRNRFGFLVGLEHKSRAGGPVFGSLIPSAARLLSGVFADSSRLMMRSTNLTWLGLRGWFVCLCVRFSYGTMPPACSVSRIHSAFHFSMASASASGRHPGHSPCLSLARILSIF